MSKQKATFYAVSNARYFPATVAMLNSLRLSGHAGDLVVGDCGLTFSQRHRLGAHCSIFTIPADIATDPVLFKAFPYLLKPRGVVVIIDSDMIVTGALGASVSAAQQGKICAYTDPEDHRCFVEWQELFHLGQGPRHQPYITSNYVVFSTLYWPNLLARWWQASACIPSLRTLAHGAPNTDPLAQGDQDALNAVLMTEVPREALLLLPDDDRPVAKGVHLQVVNPHTLLCRYNGHFTKLVHADGARKPWEHRSFLQVRNHAYVRLLRRLLFSPDVCLRLGLQEVPVWLRPGLLATALLRAIHAFNVISAPLVSNIVLRSAAKRLLRSIGARYPRQRRMSGPRAAEGD